MVTIDINTRIESISSEMENYMDKRTDALQQAEYYQNKIDECNALMDLYINKKQGGMTHVIL